MIVKEKKTEDRRQKTNAMNAARNFQDLDVWKKAHQCVLAIYKLTDTFPKQEMFGLTSQLRRAAVSIPANIVEGFKRKGIADKARFYNIAQGSLEESRYYLLLASDLGYAETRKLTADLDEVSRMLDSYIHVMLSTESRSK